MVGRRGKPQRHLRREPDHADSLYDEQRLAERRDVVLSDDRHRRSALLGRRRSPRPRAVVVLGGGWTANDAVLLELRQRLDAERDDGQQNDGDGQDGDDAGRRRALRVLEQQPDGSTELAVRQRRQLLVGSVVGRQTLVGAKPVHHVGTQLVELEFVGEYLDRNVERTTKTTSALTSAQLQTAVGLCMSVYDCDSIRRVRRAKQRSKRFDFGTSFYPRDAMRKRGLFCRRVSVRLSVCHTPVLCLNG